MCYIPTVLDTTLAWYVVCTHGCIVGLCMLAKCTHTCVRIIVYTEIVFVRWVSGMYGILSLSVLVEWMESGAVLIVI